MSYVYMSYGYPLQCTPFTVGPAFLHPFHLGESLQGPAALAWRGYQDSTVNYGLDQPRDPSTSTFSQEVAGTSDRYASDRSETRRMEDVLPRLVCEEITRATFGVVLGNQFAIGGLKIFQKAYNNMSQLKKKCKSKFIIVPCIHS